MDNKNKGDIVKDLKHFSGAQGRMITQPGNKCNFNIMLKIDGIILLIYTNNIHSFNHFI